MIEYVSLMYYLIRVRYIRKYLSVKEEIVLCRGGRLVCSWIQLLWSGEYVVGFCFVVFFLSDWVIDGVIVWVEIWVDGFISDWLFEYSVGIVVWVEIWVERFESDWLFEDSVEIVVGAVWIGLFWVKICCDGKEGTEGISILSLSPIIVCNLYSSLR